MNPRQALREFLEHHVGDSQIRDDEDLYKGGYVDSLFALELVAFVERKFGFAVEDQDLEIANFRSIDALTGFVERKVGAA